MKMVISYYYFFNLINYLIFFNLEEMGELEDVENDQNENENENDQKIE